MQTLPEGIFIDSLHQKEINLMRDDKDIYSIDVWKENPDVDKGDSCLCSIKIDLKYHKVLVYPFEFKVEIKDAN